MSSATRRLSLHANCLKPSLRNASHTAAGTATAAMSGQKKLQLGLIGSGNWGSAMSKILGENVLEHPDLFEQSIPMWVYEEEIEHKGQMRKLTQVINEEHENVKYLPGIKLPDVVYAEPNVKAVGQLADLLVFVVPHQFTGSICQQLKDVIKPEAQAISCIKGVVVKPDAIELMPQAISEYLQIYCGQLSGANIANEVAQARFSETTVAWAPPGPGGISKDLIYKAFYRDYFHISIVNDLPSVCLGGALKNIVAVAAGFVAGLGWGDNAKAAVMRKGLMEMKQFTLEYFPQEAHPDTLVHESCGVGDLITSCSGGRNFRCAVQFIKTGKSMDDLEREMLGGQKLQGASTAKEVHEFLSCRNKIDDYPLFRYVYEAVFEGADPGRVHLVI